MSKNGEPVFRGVGASIKKEFLLVSRDIHALLVLFVMPLIFILIMSLAMRDAFAEKSQIRLKAVVTCEEVTPGAADLVKKLQQSEGFEWSGSCIEVADASLASLMEQQKFMFGVSIQKGFEETISQREAKGTKIEILINPEANPYMKTLFEGSVQRAAMEISMARRMSALNPWASLQENEMAVPSTNAFHTVYLSAGAANDERPTSVQQSVPAWLIFSMFFIIIPISNTFINERRLGTLSRLATMNMSVYALVLSKITPYFLINQIQFVLMLLAGVYLVPLFGGDALVIRGGALELMAVSSVVSFASISYAIALASWVKTTEQAVTVGGVLNIIFAAIGGIMVPTFVMPQMMQEFSVVSPMSWGLESFLGIFLHQASITELIPNMAALGLFGLVLLGVAVLRLNKEMKEGL